MIFRWLRKEILLVSILFILRSSRLGNWPVKLNVVVRAEILMMVICGYVVELQ